jgi:hypothetical protein
LSTEQSLSGDAEPRIPTAIEGLETFTLSDGPDEDEDDSRGEGLDADSLFNLPAGGDDEDEDDSR